MSKQKIVLFGASLGGKRAFKSLIKQYEIISFVDNDEKKHGAVIKGESVRNPAELKSLEFDKVFIASVFSSEIVYQLRQELGVPLEKIAVVPAEVLNGDEETPWGCLSVIFLFVLIAGWVIYVASSG